MAGKNTPPGPAVDASGQSVIDPTKNVEALVKAEGRRQDGLRHADSKFLHAQVHALSSDIATERKHNRALHKMEKRLARAESKRINAIRAVDVGAVAVANAAAEARAATLAGQVSAAKDAQVVSMKAETDPIRKDIGDLRQSQWTIAGGTDQTRENKGDSRAKSSNWAIWVGVGVAVLGVGAAILGTIVSGFLVTAGIVVTYLISRG